MLKLQPIPRDRNAVLIEARSADELVDGCRRDTVLRVQLLHDAEDDEERGQPLLPIHQLEIAIGTARYDCAEEVRLVLVACVGIQQVLHKLLDLRSLPDVLALVFRDDVEGTKRRIDALICVPDIGLPHDFVPPVLIL